MRRLAGALGPALFLCLCLGIGPVSTAHAGIPTFCERDKEIGALEQDRVLRFAAAVKHELDAGGADVALVARAGLDLSRFGLLYSHAGVALKDPDDGSWAVRQLYYACDESRPRLFDQGVSGFALGADTPGQGHVALLFLPAADAAALGRAARDKRIALGLLAERYSANAYAFATRYQNCNQWVAELLASAWGALGVDDDGDALDASAAFTAAASRAHARARAQAWLRAQGYAAGPLKVPSRLTLFAGQFVPLVHVDDHPVDDLYALSIRTSTPDAIEAFVRERAPQTRRVELCHDERRIVVHHGWERLGPACAPLPGDVTIDLLH